MSAQTDVTQCMLSKLGFVLARYTALFVGFAMSLLKNPSGKRSVKIFQWRKKFQWGKKFCCRDSRGIPLELNFFIIKEEQSQHD